MNNNNDNPWSPRKVAEAHGYFSNLDEASPHHDIFASFIKDKDDANICDIGCGNGRILNNLDNYSRYLGIDTCEELITAATKHFEDNDKASFLTMDIEKEAWPEVINDYNIAYLDSTFGMMEDPLLLLKKLTKTFKTVFFNRLQLFDLGEVEAEKGTHRWGGMEKDCSLWKLSELFLHNFSSSHGGDFKIIASQSHGNGTATCAVSYER